MNFKQSLLTLTCLALAGSALLAQTPATVPAQKREARIENRADRQQKRIGQGVASGQLTPKETIRLERRQARIDRHIDKAEADGKVTKKEATVINREQNRESRRIRRQKHDGQTRK